MPDKYEKEIDEIIKRAGGDVGPRTTLSQAFADLQRRVREGFFDTLSTAFGWVTPTRVGTVGAILLVAGLIVRTAYISILGVAVLLAAYLLSIIRSSESFKQATGYERKWRGQPIDYTPNESFKEKLRRLFGKRGPR